MSQSKQEAVGDESDDEQTLEEWIEQAMHESGAVLLRDADTDDNQLNKCISIVTRDESTGESAWLVETQWTPEIQDHRRKQREAIYTDKSEAIEHTRDISIIGDFEGVVYEVAFNGE